MTYQEFQLLILLLFLKKKTANSKYPKGYTEYKWKPIHMKDLKNNKKSMVSCSMHSPYVRQLVKIWASRNKVIPHG